MASHWHSWVYLIKCGDVYKIGFSVNPGKRAKHLQTGSPEKVWVVHALRTVFYRQIERQLHDRFAKKRTRGEWFNLSEEDVEHVCRLDHNGRSPEQTGYEPIPPERRWKRDVHYPPWVKKLVRRRRAWVRNRDAVNPLERLQ